MTVSWDPILIPQRCSPELRNMAASGGRSASGREQRTMNDAGFWEIVMGGINIRRREQAAAFRAMVARLRQGEDIFVPVFEKYKPVGTWSAASAAFLTASALLRATQISVTVSGIDVRAGHYLTIDDRLHMVTSVVSAPGTVPLENVVANDSPWSDQQPWADAVTASGVYQLKISPPLRSDVAANVVVQFRYPLVRCVLKDLNDGNLELDMARFGSPSLTFIESI